MSEDIKAFGDITRDTLDRSDIVGYSTASVMGIDESVIRQISASNQEPAWMLEHRLKSLAVFESCTKPTW